MIFFRSSKKKREENQEKIKFYKERMRELYEIRCKIIEDAWDRKLKNKKKIKIINPNDSTSFFE